MRLRSELPHSLWLVDRHNPKYHGIASGWITTAITVSNMEKCINNHRKHSVLDLSLWILFYKISKKTLQFKVGWQSFWKGNNLTGALIGTVGWLASRQKKKGSLSHACILWCHNINVINLSRKLMTSGVSMLHPKCLFIQNQQSHTLHNDFPGVWKKQGLNLIFLFSFFTSSTSITFCMFKGKIMNTFKSVHCYPCLNDYRTSPHSVMASFHPAFKMWSNNTLYKLVHFRQTFALKVIS